MPHKLSPAKSTSCLLSIDLNQSLANPFHNHSMNRIRTSNLNHSDLIHSNSKQQQQQQHLHPHPHHPHHHLQHHPLEQSSHHNNTVIPSKSVSTSYGKDSIGLIESNPNETNYPHPHHHHHNHRNLNHLDQQEQRTNLFDCSFCWSSSNLVCCQSSSSSLSSSSSSSSPSSPSSSFAKQSLPTPSSSIGSTTTTIATQNSSAWFGKCRNVRLRRTDPNQSLGFSIRGGWEYGIGFYISDVQPNSLAAQQGLCPGDQIFRINGFPLDRVIHDEVVSLIRMSSNDLTLRVRSVGVVPLKNHSDDKLTWKRLCVQHSHHQHNNHLNHHHHHHHQMRTGTSTTCSASSDVSSFIFQRPRSASSLTTPSSTISSVSDDHLSSSDELIHLPLLSSSTLQEQKDSSPIMTNEYPQQQQQQQQQPIQNSHSFHQLSPSGPNDYPLSPTCSTPPSSSSTLIQSSIESMRHCDEKKLCLQGHRPGSSLGFSVVNGPINCPGIFVQNVKDGKLAQKCGLEIGDQIVRVNDHDVSIIGFDGAIAILKSTTNINLIVRKGVARHIFECRDRYTTINSCNLSKKSTDSSSSTTSLSKCHYSKLYSSSSTSTSSLSSSSTLMTHHQSSKSSKIKTKHKLSKTLNGKGMLYSVPGSIQPPPLPPPPPPPPPPLSSPSSSTHKSSTYVSTNTSTLDATGSLMINQQSNSNGNEQIISSIYDCATNPMEHKEQCQSTCPAYSSIKITGSCLSTVSGEQDQCCCRLQCHQQSDRFRNICQIYSTSNNQLDYQSRMMNNSNEDSVNHLIDINNPPHHHHHHDHYLQQQQHQHHRHQNRITSAPSIPSLLQNLNHVDQVTDAVRNSLRILQEVRRKEEKLMEASRKLNEEHEKLFLEKQRLEYEKKEMMLSNNAQKTIDENVKENLYQPAHFVTRINDCGGGGGGGQNKKSNEQQHFSSSSSSSLSPSSSSTVMAIPKTPPPPPPKIPIVSCSKIFSQTSSSQHLYSTIGPNGSASKSSSSSIETPSQDLQDDLDCGKISSPSSSSSQSSSSLSPSIPRSSLASSSSSSSSTLSTPSSSLVFAPLANSISTPQFSFLEEIKAMGENGHRRHLRPVNSLEVTEESGYSQQQQQQSEKSSEITSIMSVNQTSVSWKASKTNQLLRRSVFGDFVPPTTKPSSESSNRQTKNLTQNVTNECSNTSNDDSSCCSGVGLQSKDASENKKRQHELLMEEFRIAHRKMFGGGQRKQSIDATLNRIQSKHKDNDTAVTNTDNINANNNVDIDASAAGVSESNTLGDRFDNEDEDRKEKRNDRILNKNISDDKEIHKDVNKISCEAIAVVNRQDDDHKTIGSMKKILMRTLNDHQRSTSSSHSTTSSKSSNQDKQKQSLKCDTKNQSKILINARNKSGLFANIRKTTQTNNSDCKGNDQKGKSGSDEENRLETSNNKTSNGPNISLASIITATAAVVNASTGTSTVSSSPSIKINVSSRRDNNCDQSANNDDIDDDRDRIENNKGNLNNKSSSPSSTSSSSSPTKSISTTKSIANDRPVLSSFAVTKNTSHPYRSQQQQQQNQSNRSSINTVDVTNGGDCTGSKSSSSSSVNSSEMVKKKSPSIFSLSTIKHSNNGDGNQNPNSKNSIDCQQTMINARSTNEIVSQSSTLASGPAPPPVASSSSTSTSIVGNGNNLTNRITIKVLSPKIST